MDYHWRLLAIFSVVVPMIVWPGTTLAQAYVYAVPERTRDGWDVGSLDGVNGNAEPIKNLFNRVLNGDFKNILSVLIVRDGKLIVEEYFPRQEGDLRERAFRRVAPVEITSATKSVTSI